MREKNGVGGKIGDVSGLGTGGKIGDVSGDATFQEIQDLMLQDRRADSIECLEARVDRLQFEILAIARWLDLRMRILENRIKDAEDTLEDHETRISDLEPDEDGEKKRRYRVPASPRPRANT